MSQADVSVVLAVKNEEIYIESAVESVIGQQGLDCEVIVVDDGSTDRTFSILTGLQERFPSLIVLRNPSAGKCSAFNFGVARARGRFVCIFAGDDIMPAGSLAERYARVKDLPLDVPVVGLCKLITLSDMKRFDGHVVPKRPGRGALSGVSPLMNRLALGKIFPTPESLPNEDTWMELCVSYFHTWTIVHSDIIGCAWRVHAGNSINMMSDYVDYNRKWTARTRAVPMFLEKYGPELSAEGRARLQAKINCENSRIDGNLMGIMTSSVGLVDKLRSLSVANAFFYGARKRLYGLLSGW